MPERTVASLLAEAKPYVAAFDAWVLKYAPAATADHICYKCSSTSEFESVRAMFENESMFVYQSIISKRRIAIVKFLAPVKTSLGEIWFLELSDQKPDGSQTSGFDHIEIYPTAGSVEELANDLIAKNFPLEKIVRPHHTTFDGIIVENFKIRLEPDALIEKVKREEIK